MLLRAWSGALQLAFWSGGGLCVGYALLHVVTAAKQAPLEEEEEEEGRRSHDHNRRGLASLLASIAKEEGSTSRRERVEAAYDGAVKAHDVGFPRG